MDKLLYLTWGGQSRDEADKDVSDTDERIENRRQMRVNVDADITISSPSPDDFAKAFNLHRDREARGDDETTSNDP